MEINHEAADPLKGPRRISGINGFSLLIFAASATLLSIPLFFSWPGVAVGIAVTAASAAEVHGYLLMKRRDPQGLWWAAVSQVGVFLSLAGYSIYQFVTVDGGAILALLSPSTRQLLLDLYQVDEETLTGLLEFGLQLTYFSVFLASLLYQGSLYIYYRWKSRKLSSILNFPARDN